MESFETDLFHSAECLCGPFDSSFNVQEFHLVPRPRHYTELWVFCISAILIGMQWYPIVILICVYLQMVRTIFSCAIVSEYTCFFSLCSFSSQISFSLSNKFKDKKKYSQYKSFLRYIFKYILQSADHSFILLTGRFSEKKLFNIDYFILWINK